MAAWSTSCSHPANSIPRRLSQELGLNVQITETTLGVFKKIGSEYRETVFTELQEQL